jgi:general secretion pathway protein L
MRVETNQLSLFGLDLGRLINVWRLGWHELLWGNTAGIRRRLDDAVELRGADGQHKLFIGDELAPEHVSGALSVSYRALMMPSDSVLFTELRVPIRLEAELPDMVQLEATASSPFVAEDTCYGWCVMGRTRDDLRVAVAIAARSDVMAFLRDQTADAGATQPLPEVWCATSLRGLEVNIVLRGFGENRREDAYKRRLRWLGSGVAAGGLLLILIILLPAIIRHMQAENMLASVDRIQREAAPALEAREVLLLNNELSFALQSMIAERPDYYALLNELSAFTPDTVYFDTITLDGTEILVQGWARNAAAYIQQLADSGAYSEVRSLAGIRRHGRTQLEQFRVSMRWNMAEGQP